MKFRKACAAYSLLPTFRRSLYKKTCGGYCKLPLEFKFEVRHPMSFRQVLRKRTRSWESRVLVRMSVCAARLKTSPQYNVRTKTGRARVVQHVLVVFFVGGVDGTLDAVSMSTSFPSLASLLVSLAIAVIKSLRRDAVR